MNERIINDLAVKSGLAEDMGRGYKFPDNYLDFAELLVKKFDDILILEYLDCVGNKDKQAAERVQRLCEKVKTYFGVKE